MKLKEFKGKFPNMDAVEEAFPSGGIDGDFILVDGEVKGWNQYSNKWEKPTVEPSSSSRDTKTIYGDLNVHHNVSIGGTLSAPLIRGKNAFCGVFDTEDSLRRHRPNPVPGEWAMVFAYTTPPPTPTSETEETVETVEQNSEQVEQSNEETVSAEPVAETSETPIKRDVRDITIGFIFIENDGQWVNSGYKGGYDGTFEALLSEVEARKAAINETKSEIREELSTAIENERQYVDGQIGTVNAVTVTGSSSSYTIKPSILYKWDTVEHPLTIVFDTPTEGKANEYMIEFTVGSNFSLTLPSDIRWINGEVPEWEEGYTYQISIMDNLAIAASWEGTPIINNTEETEQE